MCVHVFAGVSVRVCVCAREVLRASPNIHHYLAGKTGIGLVSGWLHNALLWIHTRLKEIWTAPCAVTWNRGEQASPHRPTQQWFEHWWSAVLFLNLKTIHHSWNLCCVIVLIRWVVGKEIHSFFFYKYWNYIDLDQTENYTFPIKNIFVHNTFSHATSWINYR